MGSGDLKLRDSRDGEEGARVAFTLDAGHDAELAELRPEIDPRRQALLSSWCGACRPEKTDEGKNAVEHPRYFTPTPTTISHGPTNPSAPSKAFNASSISSHTDGLSDSGTPASI